MLFTISRQVADDLLGAYEAYIETAEEHEVERTTQIKSALETALNSTNKSYISVDLNDEQKSDLFDEAENRLDIARWWVHDTFGSHEHKASKTLLAGYRRLLLQNK